MPGDSRHAALALGAGDADHPVAVRLGQPQAQAARHRDAAPGQLGHLGAVAADARALDHHLAGGQRVQPAVAGRQDRPAAGALGLRAVVHQHRFRAERGELAQVRLPLHAEAPHPGAGAAQVRPGDRRPHTHQGSSARRPGGAGLRWSGWSGGGTRRPAPAGARCPPGPAAWPRAAAAARHSPTSPTHSNGLLAAEVPSSARNRSAQRGIGQRLGAAEDLPQLAGGQERGQDQVDEAALVAAAAPVVQRVPPGRCGRPGCSCGTWRGTGSAPRTSARPTAR